MNITVDELIDLFADPSTQKVAVYDLAKDEDIFTGRIDDMPWDIKELAVCSIDTIEHDGMFRVNVDTND